MNWLQYVRLIALSIGALCGIIELSLGAHLLSLTEKYFDGYLNFEALSVAVGGLTMITLPIMIVIDFLRTGAVTSLVVVELVWLSILWVLWLAAGALIANQTGDAFASCDFVSTILSQACNETHALEGFAFLGWLDLMIYTIILLIVALVNNARNTPIWTSSIKQLPSVIASRSPTAAAAPSSSDPGGVTQPTYPHSAPAAGQYPMQQYQQPPSQQQQQQPYGTPAPPQGPGYAPVPTGSPATVGGYSTTGYPQV
ncbi:hypothetical protein C8Q78DRAFT_700152 [Trametes maxima]|nr:hypothetical protein C8Q78DRAFT_700152 [Trametes maxima]